MGRSAVVTSAVDRSAYCTGALKLVVGLALLRGDCHVICVRASTCSRADNDCGISQPCSRRQERRPKVEATKEKPASLLALRFAARMPAAARKGCPVQP